METRRIYFIQYRPTPIFFFFFFNDTATTEIYTLSLHDALPICRPGLVIETLVETARRLVSVTVDPDPDPDRSEEHTSELQSRPHLVCRLLLEKKKIHALRHRPPTEQLRLPMSRGYFLPCHVCRR